MVDSSLLQIYDRDGLTLGEYVKGDMYIRDLKNTKGHISGLTCGEWHPREKQTILTSSEDGSLRIWDVNDFKTQKQVRTGHFAYFKAVKPPHISAVCDETSRIWKMCSVSNIHLIVR